MPTKRTYRRRRPTGGPLNPDDAALLLDDDPPTPDYWRAPHNIEALWRQHRGWAIKEYARRYAGTRPSLWWRWDSPEPRRRLGGIGCASGAEFPDGSYWPRGNWRFGIPAMWLSPTMAGLYRRMAWEQGRESNPRFIPIDPANPPVYESEAAYLQRLNLLLPNEADELTPEDFEPEAVSESCQRNFSQRQVARPGELPSSRPEVPAEPAGS